MISRPSIFIAEDEFLIAVQIQEALESAGWEVVGPAGTLQAALELAHRGQFDGAVLDVNLGGQRVDTVAHTLARRGVPFLFVTGYGRDVLPKAFRDQAVIVTKPMSEPELVSAVAGLLGKRAA